MIIDRLYEEVEKKGIVCVGLDTHLDYIPKKLKDEYQDVDRIMFEFNKRIIDNTLDIVPIYKLQIAYYEAYGIKGLMAYKRTLEYIKSAGSLSIGDIKRGDISSTAEMYGKAHFEGDFEADFITLNPYMGFDTITPYLKYLERRDKGIFVLLRTSNPGAKDIQYLKAGPQSNYIYYHIGDRLKELGQNYIGSCGYSLIGAVVGGTHIDEGEEIRNKYKNMFFLIPGYGRQGGKGKDVVIYLNKRNGGIVNSSRGIITSYKKYEDGDKNFEKYARLTVLDMREDILNGERI